MNAPVTNLITVTLRITRIRVRNTKVIIFFGHHVDMNSGLNDPSSTVVVRVAGTLINPENFDIGEIWEVRGEASQITRYLKDFPVPVNETQIEALGAELLKPSGSQLEQWLADNITGIGERRAQKLWEGQNEHHYDLYEVLDSENHEAIETIIKSETIRQGMFETWTKSGDAKTLRFVQERGIPLDLARKAIKFHKKHTINKLLEDPYRLLSFTGSWKVVDQLAQEKFGVAVDDTCRLAAALEESLYAGLDDGHTCQSLDDLYARTRRLLAPHPQPKSAFKEALSHGKQSGQFLVSWQNDEPMLHSCGTWIMEKAVGQFIVALLKSKEQQQNLFHADIDTLVSDFEHSEQQVLGIPDFTLNDAQINAVKTSYNNRFSIITGGAGVGKTTVLKALYKVLDTLGKPRFQMALSGRAAARMIEATHEPATTIAGFLCSATFEEMGHSPIVVIDEASMLDLSTFYRLTRKLPEDTHLILVGDPYQLPPIGAGLILHLLCNMPNIPSTELTVVKRQASDSGIPVASKLIRDGVWPQLPSTPEHDVVFIACEDKDIILVVMKLYDQDRDNTQILCATKSNPFAGVQEINRVCHSQYVATRKPLMLKNADTDELEQTGFREGDLLLYTANDWLRNLQNGLIGELTEIFDEPRKINLGNDENSDMRISLGRAVYEGVKHYVLDTDVDVIEQAYAITVHKSQGSQFQRVIVPIRKSKVLDRTFVYTAVTRAQRQVIMVGDEQAARAAVEALPKAFERKVGLGVMLAKSA